MIDHTSILGKYVHSRGIKLPPDYYKFVPEGANDKACIFCDSYHNNSATIMLPEHMSKTKACALPVQVCLQCWDILEGEMDKTWHDNQERLAQKLDPHYFSGLITSNLIPFVLNNKLPADYDRHCRNANYSEDYPYMDNHEDCVFCKQPIGKKYQVNAYTQGQPPYEFDIFLPITENERNVLSPVKCCKNCHNILLEYGEVFKDKIDLGEVVESVCFNCKCRYPVTKKEIRARTAIGLDKYKYICPGCAKNRWGMPRMVPHTCDKCLTQVVIDNLHYSSLQEYKCSCSNNDPNVEEFDIYGTNYRLIISPTDCSGEERWIYTVYDKVKNIDVPELGSTLSSCQSQPGGDRKQCNCCKTADKHVKAIEICNEIFLK